MTVPLAAPMSAASVGSNAGRLSRRVRHAGRVSLAAATLAGGLVAGIATAGPAAASASFVGTINAARASAGLAPLSVAGDLTAVAAGHSAAMAASHQLYHNPSLTSSVHNWTVLGENVGTGPDAASIASAFMASAPHRANILNSRYTQVGVAVSVSSDGALWVTEDFKRPTGSVSTPAPTSPSSGSHSTASASSTGSASVRSRTGVGTRPASGVARRTTPTSGGAPRPLTLAERLRLAAAVAGRPTDPLAKALDYTHVMATLTRH